jgi:type IV pilus assembly protein PilZ
MPSSNDERREGDRTPITLRVDYKRLNTFFADYTKNISKGGTFVRTGKPLEVGTSFVFVLSLPAKPGAAEPFQLELSGVVKWVVSEAEATPESPAGMGIQFVFQDDSERTKVEEVVAGLMRESLGETLADKLLARGSGASADATGGHRQKQS